MRDCLMRLTVATDRASSRYSCLLGHLLTETQSQTQAKAESMKAIVSFQYQYSFFN